MISNFLTGILLGVIIAFAMVAIIEAVDIVIALMKDN
jgi:hypothetical protein